MKKIALVIVLYNPTLEIYENFIDSYKYSRNNNFGKMICVDNSEYKNEYGVKISKIEEVVYIHNKNEGGLAHALNLGCIRAIKEGYEYVLLMDQDTVFPNTFFKNIQEIMLKQIKNIGILAPNMYRIIRNENGQVIYESEPLYSTKTEYVNMVVTSASIIDLKVYLSVDGFDEKLFIGHIDRDYSCKVIQKGKKILRLGTSYVYQENGNANVKKYLKFFGKKIYASNYSSIRYYYAFRNEYYERRKWGKYYKNQRSPIGKNFLLVLLLEDNKMKKIYAMIKGYLDAKKM